MLHVFNQFLERFLGRVLERRHLVLFEVFNDMPVCRGVFDGHLDLRDLLPDVLDILVDHLRAEVDRVRVEPVLLLHRLRILGTLREARAVSQEGVRLGVLPELLLVRGLVHFF